MDGLFSSFSRGFQRGLSLFVGLMTALNLVGEHFSPNFDANLWWIDLAPIPPKIANLFLGALSILLLVRAITPRWLIKPLRGLTLLVLLIALFATLGNGWVYLRLLGDGTLRGYPFPFSWIVALALGLLLWGLVKNPNPPADSKSKALIAGAGLVLSLGVCFVAVPLGQMACFGNTDYAREADVAVVFGAHAHADGICSQALADRVKKACELHHDSKVKKLIFSGGPGAGSVSEPQAMKRLAVKLGVPEGAIILDETGLNSAATVDFTAQYLRDHPNETRLIAVSHFYHLPRVKMAFQRKGVDPLTSPCVQNPVLSSLPRYMAREILAIWWYYITPLAKS